MTTLGLLGVPSSAAAHAPGLERAPAALREAGIVGALEVAGRTVVDHGDTGVARWRHDPPARTDPHDVDRVVGVLAEARDALAPVLSAGHVPLVLGGECTVTIALLAAMAEAGRDVGLVYVDGGQDLQLPADHPEEPIADSMGVAHLLDLPGTSHALAGLGPRRPLLTPDRLVLVGFADEEEDVHGLVPSERIGAAAVLDDPAAAARRALSAVEHAPDGFVVHVDVDVLDFFTLPVADVPQYRSGLTPAVLRELLACLTSDPRWAGLVLTEVNPDRDPDGVHLRTLVTLLSSALSPSGEAC